MIFFLQFYDFICISGGADKKLDTPVSGLVERVR